jgi:surfeit locus 1 family protein
MTATRRFRPPLWAWVGYLPLLLLLLLLGSWQLDRGLTKVGLDEDAKAPQTTQPWSDDLVPQITPPLPVRLRGQYRPAPLLLLDNQSYARRPGVHLWAVFEPEQGPLVIVNQGWLPWSGGRDTLPSLPPLVVDDVQSLEGLWRPLPRAGIALAQVDCAPLTQSPLLVLYPTVETLGCLLGEPVADGMLLLTPDDQHPGVREWSLTAAVPATRHFGYAAQWFMFAAVLTFFFVWLNLRVRA